jgi:type IV pilus assembly protein PilC
MPGERPKPQQGTGSSTIERDTTTLAGKARLSLERRTAPVATTSIRIPTQDIVLFTRQLAALYKGGIPLIKCLETLSEQSENPDLDKLLSEVAMKVYSGTMFSTALSHYPRVFPKILVAMVKVGEQTGSLDESLSRVSVWLERDWQLRAKVRSALMYPGFIVGVTLLLAMGLFYGVMPAFMNIFEEMKIPLPLITRVVMGFTRAFQSPLFWVVVVVAVLGIRRWLLQAWSCPEQKRVLYDLLLAVPLWGPILWHGGLSRFCGAAETLLESGVNLNGTLELAAAVCGDPVLEHEVQGLIEGVKMGRSVSDGMKGQPEVFSDTLINFLSAGEEASRLPQMFAFAAEYHALEAESRVDALKVAIEPILLAFIAVFVGGIIFAVFLPLYGFIGNL